MQYIQRNACVRPDVGGKRHHRFGKGPELVLLLLPLGVKTINTTNHKNSHTKQFICKNVWVFLLIMEWMFYAPFLAFFSLLSSHNTLQDEINTLCAEHMLSLHFTWSFDIVAILQIQVYKVVHAQLGRDFRAYRKTRVDATVNVLLQYILRYNRGLRWVELPSA